MRYVSVSSNLDTEGRRGDLPEEDHRRCDGLWPKSVIVGVNIEEPLTLNSGRRTLETQRLNAVDGQSSPRA